MNAGADPTIEFLTDGITESIINSVSQLGGLRVVPRSLVFRYKGVQADPSTIGVALNARTILTGRVSQQGDYLTIQAELVDTATESQLWGEQFRTRLSELPNVQQDISWQISEALRLKLTGEQKKNCGSAPASTPRPTRNTSAGATSSMPGRPTASARRSSTSSERSSTTPPTRPPTRASATLSAACRTTA